MNSRRRGVPSTDPLHTARRDFIKEMQDLAAAGGTVAPPPVMTAEEVMAQGQKVENDFSAALAMADESIAKLNAEVEELEEEEEEEEDLGAVDLLEKNFAPERWIIDLNEVRRPIARLLVFPGIGQSHMFYRTWGQYFALSDISVHAISMPGRGNRIKERHAGLVEAALFVVRALDAYIEDKDNKRWRRDTPLYLFGHCSGAIVAFEVAKHYNESYDKAKPDEGVLVQHLVASSCKAPHFTDEYNRDRYSKKWWIQSDSDLMDRAAMLGGVPVILRDKNRRDLLRSFVPCIREDMKAFEKYNYTPMKRKCVDDRGSIDCPVTSICCKDDKAQLHDDCAGWEEATDFGTAPGQVNCHVAMTLGGHSWLLVPAKEAALKEFLERLCAESVAGASDRGRKEDEDAIEFEVPFEDEDELVRVVETFYGAP